MSNLSQWVTDFKNHFESVESTAKAFLDEHVPGLAKVAAQLDGDPLVQAALSTVLPPEAKSMVAQWIADLEEKFPAPAAAAEPAPAPEQPPAEPPADTPVPG
jgi:hypothetical protein